MLLKNKKTMMGLAALALAGGTTMASMPAANAATMRCGAGCVTLASQKFGPTDVVAVGSASAGKLAAFWYSDSEDFYGELEGSVHDFAKAGIIPGALAKTYSSDAVYQYEYAPGGVGSDRCLAATSSSAAVTSGSAAVTLEPCGATADTLWVGVRTRQHGNFMPLVSAALSGKSAMVLTASTATGGLSVTQMSLSSTASDGVTTTSVSPYQMWETVEGVYGSSSLGSDLG